MGKIQHILHNALCSWTGPSGGYDGDTAFIQEGVYNLSKFESFWTLIKRFAEEVGVEEVKGKVKVRNACVCDGKKHYKGKEYFIARNILEARKESEHRDSVMIDD